MAAHVLTALEQLRDSEIVVSHLQSALNLACWTDELSWDDYCDLDVMVGNSDIEQILSWVYKRIPDYEDKWETLGRPYDRDSWRYNQHLRRIGYEQ